MAASAPVGSFAYMVTPGVTELVQTVVRIAREAQDRDLRELAVGAYNLAHDIFSDLNQVATKMAAVADSLIDDKIEATKSANRPQNASMETHIVSRPGPLGTVQVAMLAELEKIINPAGYGTYWRAQEFGTGQSGEMLGGTVDIPSQEGRVLFGTFNPSGDPPDAAQAGLGVGHDAAFVPGGSNPGQGIISVDLPGRHFLRDGATEAGVKYREAIGALQDDWLARLRELARLLAAERRQMTYIARLDA